MGLLVRKLWRDISRQCAPFAAAVFTTLLRVALYDASYNAYLDLQAAYAALFEHTHFADLTLTGGDGESFACQAGAVGGVAAVEVRSVADVPLARRQPPPVGRIIGLPARQTPAVKDVIVLSGGILIRPSRMACWWSAISPTTTCSSPDRNCVYWGRAVGRTDGARRG